MNTTSPELKHALTLLTNQIERYLILLKRTPGSHKTEYWINDNEYLFYNQELGKLFYGDGTKEINIQEVVISTKISIAALIPELVKVAKIGQKELTKKCLATTTFLEKELTSLS